MENRNIIIILVAVIVVLAVVIGFMLLNPTHTKVPCKIKITSDKEQYKGGKLSVKLADLNNTPLSKEVVNITVTDKKGKVVVDDVVKTNSKGKATFDLKLKKGNYKVNVTYGGNENYTADNATQKLKIKEKKKVEKSTNNDEQSNYEESSSGSSSASESDDYWETSIDAPFEYHTEYDSSGGFRQYDRAGNLVGSSYDEDQDDIADYVPKRI